MITQSMANSFYFSQTASDITVRLPDQFSPLERIILTTNGNLQRLISAYYNATVSVEILQNNKRENTNVFERVVLLKCLDQVFCKATSVVEIGNSSKALSLLESGVGLGQLFSLIQMLPEFELIDVSLDSTNCVCKRCGDSCRAFSRLYKLKSDALTCTIKEEFPKNPFHLKDLDQTFANGNSHTPH